MRRVLCAVVLLVGASSARAHSIWILPDKADPTRAKVVFSDTLAPDENASLDKVAGTKLWVRGGDKAVEWVRKDGYFAVTLPGPGVTVGGVNEYGVVQRGENKPFRLIQCPKLVTGDADRAWDKLPLEIVPTRTGDELALQVVFRGKPAPAGLEITGLGPDGAKVAPVKTDDKGRAVLAAKLTGVYGLAVRHAVAEAGESGGKKYDETRYSASLVVVVGKGAAKGDPEAMKMFEEARLARAHWKNFPGFTADVAVSVGGKSGAGTLTVSADYKLAFTGLEKDVEEAARKELTSVIGHRRDTSGEPTPAVVFDTVAGDSALGKAVRVVGDKNESGYRIRDKQLTVTQRTMPAQRFVILALENVKNADGKYLPGSHVVQYFDNATGKLVKCDSNFHSWVRVGAFDLPVTAVKMSTPGEMAADKLGPHALGITLSNHKLLARE